MPPTPITRQQDRSGLPDQEQVRKNEEKGKQQGMGNKESPEALPVYKSTSSERCFHGYNNSFIVLGRDRPGNEFSGGGGMGATGVGRIDLIAGLNSYQIVHGRKEDPSFINDAARVYISQRSDIDAAMGLANSTTGTT